METKIKAKMMSKIGYTTSMLARNFLLKNSGDRIETISNYADKFNTGRGTIQSAISFLVEHQALKLKSRGHLGSYITDLDYQLLWKIGDLGMITGLLPLPYTLHYEGLASGLNHQFKKTKLKYSIAYTRGSIKRLDLLKDNKYDFVILSKFAAETYNNQKDFEILYEFGPGSYLSKHIIVYSNPNINEIKDGMRIGLDSSSIDHKFLTKFECKHKDVEFVELTYLKIMEHIKNKTIDAAIWNYDEIKNLTNINYSDLKKEKSIKKNKKISNAVILIKKNNQFIKKILKNTIIPKEVKKIQNKIRSHTIIPEY